MAPQPSALDLPLRYRTPPAWAELALRQPEALLDDHAHLERKAATNALELLTRWPDRRPSPGWVERLSAIARDETEHLALVTRVLARRGGGFQRHHRNAYAAQLRECVRSGDGSRELVDRLLVSALIELRSCERFYLLAQASSDAALARLYRGLWASENGHYRAFLELAGQVPSGGSVPRRWGELLEAEARIIQRQPPGARIHSGFVSA